MMLKLVALLLPIPSMARAAFAHTENLDSKERHFVHPGLLHTEGDFTRVRNYVATKTEPQNTGWQQLLNNSHAQLTYEPNPQPTIYRGSDGVHGENYQILYNDAAAAYQLAVRWKVGQDAAYAKASIKILNAWASTLVALGGNDNLFLAAGLYGYQLANAGEIMRAYSGWSLADQKAFGIMLNNVFAGWNADFINTNASNPDTHFFANWDICNMASLLAIGIFNDNQTAWDYVMNYFYEGGGYGDIFRFTIANFTESGGDKRLVQGQEAGRDQGHATLDFMLYGVFAQQAWNQGVDIFGAVDSDILAGSEYCSKYNVGQDVPFTAYQGFTTISNSSRGVTRPGFELLYAHYDGIKGQNASWTGQYRDKVNDASPAKVEGGGGNYGTTSGGYDGLGFGTLLFRRD